jgi:signal transduction histidine kinase
VTYNFKAAKASAAVLFAGGLAVATGLIFWFGLRATREWERSTIRAAETRGNEVVTLLGVALERDMKGGQVSVLLKMSEQDVDPVAPYELADRFARGFARFPYLESFFVWTAQGGPDGSTYVFNRADRAPAWDWGGRAEDPYPVVFRRNPAPFLPTVTRARSYSARRSHVAMFETAVDGVGYQTLAHLMYDGSDTDARLSSIVGYTVSLPWVRAHYFGDFISQIQGVIGDPTLGIDVVDSEGHVVAAVGPAIGGAPAHTRTFPFVFADRALLSEPSPHQPNVDWTARVGVASEASRVAANRGAARTLALLGLGAFGSIIGLGFAVQAARSAAKLAGVQSEFVSAVSHEMKTPLSLIKLASNTLANGRYDTPAAVGEYGRMMSAEAEQLTRLIDNVLYYARINEATSEYDFETVDVSELIQESIDRSRSRLGELGFELHVNLPADPLFVRADHMMLVHVFDNIIDNATKYAASGRWLGVRVYSNERAVHVEIADRGEGIPAADLARVFEKFFRRKGARQRGAGLGLAIVRRVVEAHEGNVTISSVVGQGTTVDVELPMRDAS